IQIELPGVDNPERVRNLLQGVAKLEFWEVYELNEVGGILQSIDQYVVNQNILEQDTTAVGTTGGNESNDLSSLLTDDTGLSDSDTTDLADASDSTGSNVADSLFNNQQSPLLTLWQQQYGGLYYQLRDTSQINRILKRKGVQELIPNTVKFLWEVKPLKTEGVNDIEVIELHAIK
ncbi:unnamed protein product, partial [Chrysoparadoxa australica]